MVKGFVFREPVGLKAGKNSIALLCMTLGLPVMGSSCNVFFHQFIKAQLLMKYAMLNHLRMRELTWRGSMLGSNQCRS